MELILKAKDIRVEFKGRDVLDINELEVYDYDRIGLVGANGAGKSTLLRVLLGELTPPGCKMNRLGELAYIPQLDEVTLQVEKDFALVGKLGVEQLDIQTMSGGEETRLKIAQALSAQVHGILADEPTSHLDREGIDFLIGQLKYFTGALLVISHDRYFLDEIVDKIWELKDGKITEYWGNYSDYLRQKEEERKSQAAEYEQFIAERARSVLASMGFKQNDIGKSLSVLSGGEIIKLLLAKMLMGRYNILLMDEPSNFLDIPSLEALEILMKEYAGTIVFITHDKRLLENVADVVYEIRDKKINLKH